MCAMLPARNSATTRRARTGQSLINRRAPGTRNTKRSRFCSPGWSGPASRRTDRLLPCSSSAPSSFGPAHRLGSGPPRRRPPAPAACPPRRRRPDPDRACRPVQTNTRAPPGPAARLPRRAPGPAARPIHPVLAPARCTMWCSSRRAAQLPPAAGRAFGDAPRRAGPVRMATAVPAGANEPAQLTALLWRPYVDHGGRSGIGECRLCQAVQPPRNRLAAARQSRRPGVRASIRKGERRLHRRVVG